MRRPVSKVVFVGVILLNYLLTRNMSLANSTVTTAGVCLAILLAAAVARRRRRER